jgi:hypothetical protein
MDCWAALAEIESLNNDCAVGAVGEISRYQIRLELWLRHAPVSADWENPEDALAVAWEIMAERWVVFQRDRGRPPNHFEFYVLWNAPSQIARPSKVVRERAERFCNLVAST